jgi:hypothetical protein
LSINFWKNKTENHFSPYPRSEGDINLYTYKVQNFNVLLIAGKACNKLPAYGRKKACNPAGLRLIKGCNMSAMLPGKAAGQGCRERLSGKAAWQGCMQRCNVL